MSTNALKDTKNFLKAKSLMGLRRSMRRLNAKYGVQHQFHNFYCYVDKNGNEVHVAWYEPTEQELQDELNDNAK